MVVVVWWLPGIMYPVASSHSFPTGKCNRNDLRRVSNAFGREDLLAHHPRLGALPKTLFLFDVNYVTRRHKVEKDLDSFLELNKELESELLTVPVLPEAT